MTPPPHPADPQGPKLTGDDVLIALVWNSGETHILPDQTADALNRLIAARQPSGDSGQLAAAGTPTPALDELFQSANAASSITGRKWMSLEVKHGTFRQALAELRALKGQQP